MRLVARNIILIVFIAISGVQVFAQSVGSSTPTLEMTASSTPEDLIKSQIDDRSSKIKQLETEIQQYNVEVTNVSGQAKTLQNTLKTLDLTKRKISKEINLTENKIGITTLTIGQLGTEIDRTQKNLDVDKRAILSALKNMQSLENRGFMQLILSNGSIGEAWKDLDNVGQTSRVIKIRSQELTELKADIETKRSALKNQKNSLVSMKQDLSGKKQAVEYTTAEKATVLAETKGREQAYLDIIKTKEDQKAQFEKEIYDFESQLNITVDRESYPLPRNSILSWPLDNIFVTQKFGKTVGAQKLYTSGSHNGVDFRASRGTRVKNVLDGEVVGTGNTDIYRGCYSFGKWVMVKHSNGLSTIYGHLSVISVTPGQDLSTGDLIGYSGNTGYSTGPHLHISVYATQGVRIEKFVNSHGCKAATLPLADIKAYLDPLAYFPTM